MRGCRAGVHPLGHAPCGHDPGAGQAGSGVGVLLEPLLLSLSTERLEKHLVPRPVPAIKILLGIESLT